MKQVLFKYCLLAGMLLVGRVSAVTLTVSPATQTAIPGDTVIVDILASELPAGEVISGYDLMLGYDSTRLIAKNVLFGGALGGATPADVLNGFILDFQPNSLVGDPNFGVYSGTYNNAVEFFELSLAAVTDYYATLSPLQIPGPFMLARITFELRGDAAAGLTSLQLLDDRFFTAPPDGGAYDVKGVLGTNILTTTLQNGSVTVGVPLPGTAWLMLVAGLVGLARRRWS